MSEHEAAETADSDRDPPRAWEEQAREIGRVTDPHLHRVLVNTLERDREQWAQRARYLVELRTMRHEIEERDARIFAELGTLLALMQGTAARVARLDQEREVTRQEVRDVHRWAEELKRDAETSQQREVVTAQKAVDALERVARAELEETKAKIATENAREKLQSFTSEVTVRKTEHRAQRWTRKHTIFAAVLGIVSTGIGAAITWAISKFGGK